MLLDIIVSYPEMKIFPIPTKLYDYLSSQFVHIYADMPPSICALTPNSYSRNITPSAFGTIRHWCFDTCNQLQLAEAAALDNIE
jgi:hypothetical protein